MPSVCAHLVCLSIDTSGPACQAVVSVGDNVAAFRSTAMLRGHGEALVPMVEEVLAEAGIDYGNLDRIGVTIGPGSFTGMRVGLAAARGFAATLSIPTLGLGTLEALAVSDRLDNPTSTVRCVAVDARNALVYGQRFAANDTALEPPAVLDELVFSTSVPDKARLVGSASHVIAALVRSAGRSVTLGRADPVPTPAALALLTAAGVPGSAPRPLYLKAADAVAAKPSGLRQMIGS